MEISQQELDHWVEQLAEINAELVHAITNPDTKAVARAQKRLVTVVNALLRAGAADPSGKFYEQTRVAEQQKSNKTDGSNKPAKEN